MLCTECLGQSETGVDKAPGLPHLGTSQNRKQTHKVGLSRKLPPCGNLCLQFDGFDMYQKQPL